MIRPMFCAALVAACLASPARALATEAEEREAAKTAFVEGSALFDAKDFEAALERFSAAQAIAPHDKVRIPIATCLERLARFREAIQQWKVVAASEQVEAAQQQQAREAITRLEPRLARLVIEGAPVGALVVVDGEAHCELPCEPAVDPGPHEVVVRSATAERRQRLSVERGERRQVTLTWPRPEGEAPTKDVSEARSEESTEGGGYSPGVLTWVGAGVATVGVAGVIGFGLQASAKHDSYLAAPSDETRDAGLLARNLSNASIAIGAVGVVLVAIDLAFLAPSSQEVLSAGMDGLSLRF